MKFTAFIFLTLLLWSCGTKVPYTNQIKDEFGLDSEKQMRKVQFYTSATIILEKNKATGNQGTSDDGSLVASSRSEQNRLIFPANTKCLFEGYGPNGEMILRFEPGDSKSLTFAIRPNQTSGKFYLSAEWGQVKGGKLSYGNETYYASSPSANAFLQVVLKKLQKTKRKDRIVKGMRI
jgi:hypothetical protein